MSKKNRSNVIVSNSTQTEAAIREQPTEPVVETQTVVQPPVPTDEQLNEAIGEKTDGADVQTNGTAERNPKDSSPFRLADDVAKKGPYKTEEEARLPHNIYRNKGPQWEVYEIDLIPGTSYTFADGTVSTTNVFVYAVNIDLAISFVAKKQGMEGRTAGKAKAAPGMKAKLAEAQDAVAAERAKNAAILAKLKEMGIEL